MTKGTTTTTTVTGVRLAAPDPDAAAAFYGGLLGWSHDAGVLRAADGTPVAALTGADGPLPGWSVTLAGVADRAVAAGGRPLGGAAQAVADPGGAAFSTAAAPVPLPAPGPGRPVWFENMTTAAAAVDAFYAAVTGWATQPAGPGYVLFTAEGRPVAGRLDLPPDLAAALGPRWMVYLAHADVDAAATAVAGLGGVVAVPPRDTPTGRLTAVVDPGGAVVTLLTPA